MSYYKTPSEMWRSYNNRYPQDMQDEAYNTMQNDMRNYSGAENPINQALKMIEAALSGETEDKLFYEYLLSVAPSEQEKQIIAGIRDDEMKHYDLFRQLYYELAGKMPPALPGEEFEKPASYCEGLKKALLGEQNAVRKYREILFAMMERKHINTMTFIITDEIRHLGLYNFLYANNNCNT